VPRDPRTRIFTPLPEIERSMAGLTAAEVRAARIAFVADALSLFHDEQHWTQHCVPPYWVQCLIPPLWPVLWYRGKLSRMAQHAIATAIQRCRQRWGDDLQDSGLSFVGIPPV
jgi:hypothetical protein